VQNQLLVVLQFWGFKTSLVTVTRGMDRRYQCDYIEMLVPEISAGGPFGPFGPFGSRMSWTRCYPDDSSSSKNPRGMPSPRVKRCFAVSVVENSQSSSDSATEGFVDRCGSSLDKPI
jgi:hypothetical protein